MRQGTSSLFLGVETGCGFTSCLAKLHIVLQFTGQVSSAPAHPTSPPGFSILVNRAHWSPRALQMLWCPLQPSFTSSVRAP